MCQNMLYNTLKSTILNPFLKKSSIKASKFKITETPDNPNWIYISSFKIKCKQWTSILNFLLNCYKNNPPSLCKRGGKQQITKKKRSHKSSSLSLVKTYTTMWQLKSNIFKATQYYVHFRFFKKKKTFLVSH